MIRVDTELSLEKFEAILSQISYKNDELMLANSIKAEAFGGIAGLVQLIITWSKKSASQHDLKIYGEDLHSQSVLNFAKTVHGLTAVNSSNSVRAVSTDIELKRSDLLRLSIPFVLAMHSKDISELKEYYKSTIPLVCIDNARSILWPIRLYRKENIVRSKEDFEYLLKSCIDSLGSAKFEGVDYQLLRSAARLLHEAFLNTHDHARRDFNGDGLRRSVRGVLIGERDLNINQLIERSAEGAPLRSYFSEWKPIKNSLSNARFMDISIFDSGPGLAQTWLARQGKLKRGLIDDDIQLKDELGAVTACLNKGFGVKSGFTNGNGLFRIMEVVSKAGGFVRIRTGRLSLVKAFPQDAPPLEPSNLFMEDALVGGPPQLRAWSEGTTISVLLPLNQRKHT